MSIFLMLHSKDYPLVPPLHEVFKESIDFISNRNLEGSGMIGTMYTLNGMDEKGKILTISIPVPEGDVKVHARALIQHLRSKYNNPDLGMSVAEHPPFAEEVYIQSTSKFKDAIDSPDIEIEVLENPDWTKGNAHLKRLYPQALIYKQ